VKAEKEETTDHSAGQISRDDLIELLNEDLSGEYQAIISYVVYSQVLSGAEYMNIAGELEKHAAEELSHALIISEQIDYLGGMPAVLPKHVRTSKKPKEMLQFDLENEMATIRRYRERVHQCDRVRCNGRRLAVSDGVIGKKSRGAVAAQVRHDHAIACRCEQRRNIDKTVNVVRPAVQKQDGRAAGRTGFGVADVQDAGIDLLQRTERGVRAPLDVL